MLISKSAVLEKSHGAWEKSSWVFEKTTLMSFLIISNAREHLQYWTTTILLVRNFTTLSK